MPAQQFIMQGMRLVLAWLIGVPLLVGSMVLARAAFMPAAGDAIPVARAQPSGQAGAKMTAHPDCQLRHVDEESAVPAIKPDRVPCDALAIQ